MLESLQGLWDYYSWGRINEHGEAVGWACISQDDKAGVDCSCFEVYILASCTTRWFVACYSGTCDEHAHTCAPHVTCDSGAVQLPIDMLGAVLQRSMNLTVNLHIVTHRTSFRVTSGHIPGETRVFATTPTVTNTMNQVCFFPGGCHAS